MASTTLALYKSNWVELKSTVTHVGDAWLRSAFYEDSVNGRIYKLRNPVAVLQFGITGTIAGKTIKSVKLNYYAKATSPHSITTGAGIAVAPFLCDGNALDHLTASRVMTSGLLGEWQVLEQGNMQSTAYTYPQWRVVDITDIFKSNIYNNAYFTIMLISAPGITTDEYTEIGGVGSEYAAYLSVEYEDDPQKNPTPTYPNSVYVNEYTDILFAWAWNSTTEATQASVQLEYKLKTAGSYTVVNLTQSTQTYKLVGGLAQGVYTWRIKGTNSAGTTSDFSIRTA